MAFLKPVKERIGEQYFFWGKIPKKSISTRKNPTEVEEHKLQLNDRLFIVSVGIFMGELRSFSLGKA